MKKAGIVLLVIQAVAVIAGFATHQSPITDLFTSDEAGAALIGKLIGYFIPAIVGIILLRKAAKKEREAAAEPSAAPASSASYASSGVCPKCGAKVEPDDMFCVNCGVKLH